MWNTDKSALPEPEFMTTPCVWIKCKDGRILVASLHTANRWWYPSKDIHGIQEQMVPDADVLAWQPITIPED